MKISRKTGIILLLLNAIAIAATVYLTYMHIKPDASTLCNISEGFNCDIVNKSKYAKIFGVPVAVLGLINYLFLFGFTIAAMRKDLKKWIAPVFALVTIGLGFSLYLSYIEAFLLMTWCIFCVVQQIVIAADWGIFLHLYRLTKKS